MASGIDEGVKRERERVLGHVEYLRRTLTRGETKHSAATLVAVDFALKGLGIIVMSGLPVPDPEED